MASPFDLVSLVNLKCWLDVSGTNDDVLLARLITQISRAILNVIDRPTILPSVFTEIRDGGNEVSIMLRQWPVIGVSSCIVNGITVPPSPALTAGASSQIGYVLEAPDAAPPGGMQRLSMRHLFFTCGLQNIMVTYNAGYQITNESVAIPIVSPYSIMAQAPYGDWACDEGVINGNGLSLTSVIGIPSAGQYSVVDGIYNFSQADAGLTVLLSYGYVPADLASCCMDWISDRYAYRSRIGQHSKSLGGQETMSFIVKDIPDFVTRCLAPYRRVLVP